MNIVKLRKWFFALSALFIIPGIISLIIPGGFKLGIDFSSGSVATYSFTNNVSEKDVRTAVENIGHPEAIIQKIDEKTILIRSKLLKESSIDDQGVRIESEKQLLEDILITKFGDLISTQYDATHPIIASETVRNAAIAVIIAAFGILLYVTWAFKSIPNSFRYGTAAIVALVHDLLIVVGLFSILGRFMNLEINAMFIVGLLTVLGYSVNDTIVIFDRIRENLRKQIEQPLDIIINDSIFQNLGRSMNTSFTTTLVLVALLLMGGSTIQSLLIALLIGVFAGTYSSIAIASQFLVFWEKKEFTKLFSIKSSTSS